MTGSIFSKQEIEQALKVLKRHRPEAIEIVQENILTSEGFSIFNDALFIDYLTEKAQLLKARRSSFSNQLDGLFSAEDQLRDLRNDVRWVEDEGERLKINQQVDELDKYANELVAELLNHIKAVVEIGEELIEAGFENLNAPQPNIRTRKESVFEYIDAIQRFLEDTTQNYLARIELQLKYVADTGGFTPLHPAIIAQFAAQAGPEAEVEAISEIDAIAFMQQQMRSVLAEGEPLGEAEFAQPEEGQLPDFLQAVEEDGARPALSDKLETAEVLPTPVKVSEAQRWEEFLGEDAYANLVNEVPNFSTLYRQALDKLLDLAIRDDRDQTYWRSLLPENRFQQGIARVVLVAKHVYVRQLRETFTRTRVLESSLSAVLALVFRCANQDIPWQNPRFFNPLAREIQEGKYDGWGSIADLVTAYYEQETAEQAAKVDTWQEPQFDDEKTIPEGTGIDEVREELSTVLPLFTNWKQVLGEGIYLEMKRTHPDLNGIIGDWLDSILRCEYVSEHKPEIDVLMATIHPNQTLSKMQILVDHVSSNDVYFCLMDSELEIRDLALILAIVYKWANPETDFAELNEKRETVFVDLAALITGGNYDDWGLADLASEFYDNETRMPDEEADETLDLSIDEILSSKPVAQYQEQVPSRGKGEKRRLLYEHQLQSHLLWAVPQLQKQAQEASENIGVGDELRGDRANRIFRGKLKSKENKIREVLRKQKGDIIWSYREMVFVLIYLDYDQKNWPGVPGNQLDRFAKDLFIQMSLLGF